MNTRAVPRVTEDTETVKVVEVFLEMAEPPEGTWTVSRRLGAVQCARDSADEKWSAVCVVFDMRLGGFDAREWIAARDGVADALDIFFRRWNIPWWHD